jgi:glycosyltransferase involved in cell wall biosynthesis
VFRLPNCNLWGRPEHSPQMKLSIIIAVYNEANSVAQLLERVLAQPLGELSKEIIVIESNSTDGSRQIVADFVQRHASDSSTRILAIYQDKPVGKGHAVRQGFAVATGDIFLIQDADLEYDVADYPALLQPILQGQTAFVLGSRHLGENRWHVRKYAHKGLQTILMNAGGILFHVFFNAVFSTRLTDPTSMYKVFRADCLRGLDFHCNRFDFDFELLGRLIRAGFSPIEVPVSYRSRGFNEGKKIRVFRDPPSWLLEILRCRFARVNVAQNQAKHLPEVNSPSSP